MRLRCERGADAGSRAAARGESAFAAARRVDGRRPSSPAAPCCLPEDRDGEASPLGCGMAASITAVGLRGLVTTSLSCAPRRRRERALLARPAGRHPCASTSRAARGRSASRTGSPRQRHQLAAVGARRAAGGRRSRLRSRPATPARGPAGGAPAAATTATAIAFVEGQRSNAIDGDRSESPCRSA